MRVLISVCILLFAVNTCNAQPSAGSGGNGTTAGIFVQGTEVRSGPVASMLEAFSNAFNPWQDNTHWPLYAYSVDGLASGFCENFSRTSLARDSAFVGRVAGALLDGIPRYMGIQIDNTSGFRYICRQVTESPQGFADVLNDYIFSIEGVETSVHRGRLERLGRSAVVVEDSPVVREACVRRVTSGSLSSAGVFERLRFAGSFDGEGDEIRWVGSGSGGQSEQRQVELIWSEGSGESTSVWNLVRGLQEGWELWQFAPSEPVRIGGSFVVSYDNSSRRIEVDDSIASSWNNGDIEWEGMPSVVQGEVEPFEMWYVPPFCGVSDDEPWYLVSDERLDIDGSERFRTRIVPLSPIAGAVAQR